MQEYHEVITYEILRGKKKKKKEKPATQVSFAISDKPKSINLFNFINFEEDHLTSI